MKTSNNTQSFFVARVVGLLEMCTVRDEFERIVQQALLWQETSSKDQYGITAAPNQTLTLYYKCLYKQERGWESTYLACRNSIGVCSNIFMHFYNSIKRDVGLVWQSLHLYHSPLIQRALIHHTDKSKLITSINNWEIFSLFLSS